MLYLIFDNDSHRFTIIYDYRENGYRNLKKGSLCRYNNVVIAGYAKLKVKPWNLRKRTLFWQKQELVARLPSQGFKVFRIGVVIKILGFLTLNS